MNNRNPEQDLQRLQGLALEPFPEDMPVETIEYFDNYGLMISSTPEGFFETKRSDEQITEFVALYVNGELGCFEDVIKGIILFDRTQKLTKELVTKRSLNPIGEK